MLPSCLRALTWTTMASCPATSCWASCARCPQPCPGLHCAAALQQQGWASFPPNRTALLLSPHGLEPGSQLEAAARLAGAAQVRCVSVGLGVQAKKQYPQLAEHAQHIQCGDAPVGTFGGFMHSFLSHKVRKAVQGASSMRPGAWSRYARTSRGNGPAWHL